MGKTAQPVYSPKAIKKNFMANAKYNGMTFVAALETQKASRSAQKVLKPAGIVRRNPGRMDGVRWHGKSFIWVDDDDESASEVESESDDDDDSTWYVGAVEERPLPTLPSLLDIARTAKPKGVAKEFEIVEGVRRTIALDDEDDRDMWNGSEDDDWEEIMSEHTEERRSYSMVIRGWVGSDGG